MSDANEIKEEGEGEGVKEEKAVGTAVEPEEATNPDPSKDGLDLDESSDAAAE